MIFESFRVLKSALRQRRLGGRELFGSLTCQSSKGIVPGTKRVSLVVEDKGKYSQEKTMKKFYSQVALADNIHVCSREGNLNKKTLTCSGPILPLNISVPYLLAILVSYH